MASKDNTCMVIVTIEIGHQANFLKEPSIEGFTHDWTVFVGGYEGSKIEHFVEKVIFNLHKTFKRPTRVISEPPYRVSECGYAGFTLPIDIYFKTQQKPRKITFMYDLFLNARDSPPINNVRYEKLKFQNPTPDFKAKLIKAGGTEQGLGPVQPVVSDRFYSPENKISSKVSEKKHKEKKLKKSKIVRPPSVPSSPHPSLSSLSPMSSDEEPEKPIPSKKEREPPVLKKESSYSSSLKKEPSSSSSKDKPSKHRSSGSSGKEKHGSDKNKDAKPHKAKEKEKSSEHHKEGKSKEKESSSHKSTDSHGKHKEKDREGSHSSSKSSSSLNDKKSSSSSHKEKSSSKEKESGSKEKHKSSHKPREGEEKMSIKEREREKEKHSHKDSNSSSVTGSSKKFQELSKAKSSHEKDKHSKNPHKRNLSPGEAFESEKKKLKLSISIIESDIKVPKVEKEKIIPNLVKDSKDVKPKDSHKMASSSSSSQKSKEHKKKSSEKSKHSRNSSEGKSKPGKHNTSEERKVSISEKHPDGLQQAAKTEKAEASMKSERMALSADFQPQLLLSPLKSKSEDENDHEPGVDFKIEEPNLEKTKSRSNSNSSLSSLSSDHESGKSDNEKENQSGKTNPIVSGLTDSDSDSDEPHMSTSHQKEVKPRNFVKDNVSVKPKKFNAGGTAEKVRKSHGDSGNTKSFPSPFEKKNGGQEAKEHSKRKYEENEKNQMADSNTAFSSPKNVSEDSNKNGLNVLAPNGIPIGELISINERIEKAQQDSNKDLINSIIDIIAETDDFDIDDSTVFFDICTLNKSCVQQIQSIL